MPHEVAADLRIEQARGETYAHDDYAVYSYSEYEPWSVLAGQVKRSYVDGGFATVADAKAAYPHAVESGCGYQPLNLPHTPPAWFDPANAGEAWDEDDY